MKYYSLRSSINEKEVGTFPQCIDANRISDIQEFGFGYYERIDKNFILPELPIRKSAKLSNLLTVTAIDTSIFKVMDDDLLEFLIQFNISDYQTWKLKAEHRGKTVDQYNLFHLSNPIQDQLIDFSRSKFKTVDISNHVLEEKTYIDYDEYQKDWAKLILDGSVIKFDTLHLDFSTLNLDLIRLINIYSIGIGYYVSEKLKNAIEEMGFTGFAFQEIEEMDKKIKAIY